MNNLNLFMMFLNILPKTIFYAIIILNDCMSTHISNKKYIFCLISAKMHMRKKFRHMQGNNNYTKGSVFMTISLAGYHWQHDESFSVVRENGYHGLQLLLVQTDGIVKIDNKTYHVSPNTAFIIDSCVPHAIFANGKPYMDDWIRFQLAPGEREMFDELELPVNRPILLGDDDTLTTSMNLACKLYNDPKIDNEKVYHNILMVILLYLNNYSKTNEDQIYIPYEKNLYDLRKEIYANPGVQWSMPQISKDLGLSVGYLNKLYRQLFGTSCMNDVYTARMQYAMELLSDIDTPVFEIAEKCGYNSSEHFSRMFRKYACLSPADYRKKLIRN